MKRLSLVLILLLAAVALGDGSGPVSPGTIVEDQSSGSTAWANPENVAAMPRRDIRWPDEIGSLRR